MTTAPCDAPHGEFGLVLAARDRRHGLGFWGNECGFGPLFNATVFSEAEAATFDAPIADSPEWMVLPAPRDAGEQP